MEDDMIGAIKIKDALFIGDEYAAQVSLKKMQAKVNQLCEGSYIQLNDTFTDYMFNNIGFRIRCSE